MKKLLYIFLVVSVVANSCKKENATQYFSGEYNDDPRVLSKIAFGSCASQMDYFALDPVKNRGIFSTIVDKNPDVYIAGGDNVYADIIAVLPGNVEYINTAYRQMWADPDFMNLRNNVPIIATWDDHDYGQNDGTSMNVSKVVAKNAFLSWWKIPQNSPIRKRDGIYQTYYYGPKDKRVQVIMLDLRYFQSAKGQLPLAGLSGYSLQTDTNKTMLGALQWAWLKQELKKPAKVRIIMSSMQFSAEYNKFENWAVFPHEIENMYDVIRETKAEGVFFLSGDVHYADMNVRKPDNLYPMYDFTSSGLTHIEKNPYTSIYRNIESFHDLNFGMVRIDWNTTPVSIKVEICNKAGDVVREKEISLDDLKF
ncbi:MAG TPA: alkaline phosphatase D family protein [Chitinophagales bacterium]|nr:alkaline phosphatase D family protein [Chitinophagales bacterium]